MEFLLCFFLMVYVNNNISFYTFIEILGFSMDR